MKENNEMITKTDRFKSAVDTTQEIVTDDSIDALKSALDVVKQEYGEFKLTKTMKRKLAKELGESEETVDGWQTVVDILDRIDMAELAKKHPEAIGKVAKTIISVVSFFVPVVKAADIVPQEFAAKLVEYAGTLTPEHLINIIAKKQVEKNKAKREQLANEEYLVVIDEEEDESIAADKLAEKAQIDKSKGLKAKLTEGSKKTMGSISGFFSKKKSSSAPQGNSDVLDTIKKLSELRDSGIITQEEFDAKKAELLAKL